MKPEKKKINFSKYAHLPPEEARRKIAEDEAEEERKRSGIEWAQKQAEKAQRDREAEAERRREQAEEQLRAEGRRDLEQERERQLRLWLHHGGDEAGFERYWENEGKDRYILGKIQAARSEFDIPY